jgi:hypothetical protein
MNIEPILQKKENPPVAFIPMGRNDKNIDDEIIRYDTVNKRFVTDNTPIAVACMMSASASSALNEDEDEEQ